MQSIDLIRKYEYGTIKDLVSDKEEIKCNKINKTVQKMINFDDVVNEKTKRYNPCSHTISHKFLIIHTKC